EVDRRTSVSGSERGETASDGVADQSGRRTGADLAHRIRPVGLHRCDAHEEPGRDFREPTPFADELDHLALAGAEEGSVPATLDDVVGDQAGDGGREVAFAARDGLDRLTDLVRGRFLENVPGG